jgi:hypothetical protein
MVNNNSHPVAQAGIFGLSDPASTASDPAQTCYFRTQDQGQTDLLT